MDTSFISNRRVAARPLEPIAGQSELKWPWFVSDRADEKDSDARSTGEPIAYATPNSTLCVTTGYNYWVVCNSRGQWLKGRAIRPGQRGRARRFATPLAAAKIAEQLADDVEGF